LVLFFQPREPHSPLTSIYILTLEELTSNWSYLSYEFHQKCCACGHDRICDKSCCTCEYWDCCNSDDDQYDF
jgi:hypothetical protein